jgi:hypothetical protein
MTNTWPERPFRTAPAHRSTAPSDEGPAFPAHPLLIPHGVPAVAEIYEFHVTGLIGPVVRSALPELATGAGEKNSVLSGTANGPEEVDQVLRRLGDAGLTPSHIVISNGRRWRSADETESAAATGAACSGGAVPVVDDNGAQHNVLE